MKRISGPDDFAAAFGVSRETLDRLATYEKLLQRWQKAVNLVAPSTLGDVWHRHFADSAQLVALAPQARTWVDLGSGGGFPGLVVAILVAGSPQGRGKSARITLIESDTRKCAFLREVVRQTGISPGAPAGSSPGLAVDILSIRIENGTTQSRLQAPEVVSARALAPLDKLLSLAAPLFAPNTVGLFLKGREAEAEIEAAAKAWDFDVDLVPSMTDASGRIVVVRQLERKAKE
ncbi:MAG: 16S rRNA (guanine(527)-N(7))-methyltransferase RsmG [Hyphomicrobiaceae bacterium]|nr:MAG: 16S rRNA (guanine(527)-N(7))-methyltransferase RsmG [Hyphomicrobiaceae bacterium]